jgi:hypothetical protein
MTKEKKGVEAFADEAAQARFAENQEIARNARALRSELTKAREELAAATTEVAALQHELDLFAHDYKRDRPEWTARPKKATPNHATIVPVFSDLHDGEVVRPEEMGGFNKYDERIAEIRTQRFFTKTVTLTSDFMTGIKFDGVVVPFLGDLVSGDIHAELVETNQSSTYRTAVKHTVPMIAEGLEVLRKRFGKVHAVFAPGNHGRDSQKPRYKGRSDHNADTLIAWLVAREFKGVDGVTFEIPETLDATFELYGFTFGAEHGDELKAFAGAAEIGVLGPLMRGTNRKKVAIAAEGKTLDYALWGHFHQLVPVPSRGFIANGSIKGYDEYARGRKFKPERPQQALLLCTPEHGITFDTPIFVQDRKAEGW